MQQQFSSSKHSLLDTQFGSFKSYCRNQKMASSSHRRTSWNSPTSFTIQNKYCWCNRKATLKISESENNPNKLYFFCAKCKYFQWYEGPEEEEVNSRNYDTNSVLQSHLQQQRSMAVRREMPIVLTSAVAILFIINLILVAVYVFIHIVKSIG